MIKNQFATYLALYICNEYFHFIDRSMSTFIQSILLSFFIYIFSVDLNTLNKLYYLFLKYIKKDNVNYNFTPIVVKKVSNLEYSYNYNINDLMFFKEWIISLRYVNNITLENAISMSPSNYCGNNGDTENPTDYGYIPIYRYDYGKYVYMIVNNEKISYYDIFSGTRESIYDVLNEYYLFEKNMKDIKISNKIFTLDNKNNVYIKNNCGVVSDKKIFDNLFFKGNDELIQQLIKFKNGELTSERHLADNKFCMLFYGEYGTGKTSIISSISNLLNRSILIFDLSINKKKNDFIEAIKVCIQNKYILVLEEFDCLLSVIKSRDELQNTSNSSVILHKKLEYLHEELSKTNDLHKIKEIEKIMSELQPSNLIDLGTILTELDGIKSTNDLCVLATTNYCDRIDSALLRDFRLKPFKLDLFDKELTETLIRHLYYLDDEYINLGIKDNIKINPSKISYLSLKYKSYIDLVIALNEL